MDRLVTPALVDPDQIGSQLRRTTLALAFGLVLPIVALTACVIFLVNSISWVERSDQVISQSHTVERELVTMPTNFRGYRLTSEPSLMERFEASRQRLPTLLDELEKQVASSTENIAEVSALRREIETWIQHIDGEMVVGRQQPQMLRNPAFLRGAPMFDAALRRLDGMTGNEQRLHERRNRFLGAVVATLFGSLGLLAFLGVPFLVVSVRRRLRNVSNLFENALDAEQARSRELSATLFSIGDAVIASDAHGKIMFLNPAAEHLTGWSNLEAKGMALREVFTIFNEHSGAPVESPVDRVLRENVAGGLANHTVLRTKGGAEMAIEDSAAPIRNEDGTVCGVILVFRDATQSRLIQRESSERESRLRLLNELGEGTRALRDSAQIMAVSARLLGRHLQASRCAYAEVADSNHFQILHDYTDGCATTVGSYSLSLFGTRAMEKLLGARTLVVSNVRDELPADAGGSMFAAIGVQAIVCFPLIRERTLRALMAVQQVEPRTWTGSEISLVEEIGERCWATIERARAEAEVRVRATFSDLRGNVILELNRRVTLAECLQTCCALISQTLGSKLTRIWILEEPASTMALIASAGEMRNRTSPAEPLEMSHSVIGQIARTRTRYASHDLARDPMISEPDRLLFAGASAFAGFPLVVQEVLLGVVGIASDQDFPESTLAEIESIFDLVSHHISQFYADSRLNDARERADAASLAVAETAERFRILSEVVPLQFWTATPTGELDFANSECQQYFGVSDVASVLGHAWATFVHPEDLPSAQALWEQSLKSGARYEVGFRLRRSDEEYRWFLVRAEAMRGEGVITKWFGTNTDVHDLKVANAEAERATRAKDDFLAVLSHELRTPLTPVLMTAAELRGDPRLPEEVRSQLAMIERNIGLEARLIDDLLDLTRIARNKLPVRLEPCDAHSLIGLAVDIIKDEALTKAITVNLHLAAKKSSLLADPSRFQQVIWNLLRNAVKFTPVGGVITVESSNELSEAKETFLRIAVRDTGIGIKPDAISRIFEPFEQADLQGDHKYGGVGLGLSIAQSIVKLHGGTIEAESEGVGHGASFIVRFPGAADLYPGLVAIDAAAAASANNASVPDELAMRRILLVEDHEPTLKVMVRLLTNSGYYVVAVSSVGDGLAAASREAFDLVVSDLGLPDGTGNDLMRQLKEKYDLRGIALTGYGMDDDIARSQEAGFVAHLIKPVDFALLKRTIVSAGRS